MSEKNNILKLYASTANFNSFIKLQQQPDAKKIALKGLIGSSTGFFLSNCFENLKHLHLVILNDKEEAAYFLNDLNSLMNEEKVIFFPSSFKRSAQYGQVENQNILDRTKVLESIYLSGNKSVIVTYPEAIIEKIISKSNLQENTLKISQNENLGVDFVIDVLNEYKFERTDFVYEPGQYAVRGSIVDVYSYTYDDPYRIDFFGDEVETIRSFDVENQLSKKHFSSINITPNITENISAPELGSLFHNLNKNTLIWINDTNFVFNRIAKLYQATDTINPELVNSLSNEIEIKNDFENFTVIEFGSHQYFSNNYIFNFNQSYQPQFKKNFENMADDLINNQLKGYTNYIISENLKQTNRLQQIFTDIDPEIKFTAVDANLHVGFIDHDLNICCYTDHQIFERFHRFRLKEKQTAKAAIALKELNSLQPGDYVVHIDHGIGTFGGLQTLENNGKKQEVIRLVYKDQDVLFVNIQSLHKISKYKGKDAQPPKIYKLGSGAWSKLKNTTKSKVKDIAKDLIALYANRKTQQGFSFSPDSYLNKELEASFIYEDTPDQLKASNAVKRNMEASTPMDHLVCGDVGFGKTEIAIRAAFKAAADNKQVAILVPTTILAFQHYHTFKNRLKSFPVNVDYISRFKKPKEQKESINKLIEGKTDIIIGTHRLIGKDIKFKDLGLLVIDEEQKFGVSVKEKLKQLKMNIDTLTLTATPIPRTLQFSLMGVRDLSIINTPPPNRQPIITELHSFNEEIIRDAIEYEVSRNGQVFFINNRVQNINEVVELVKRICPKVNVIAAHGQMEGKVLEKIMFDFIQGDYDVLVATTIVESGLDIPNANTIIINDAQNFGLSDLHQLRGRVGRSNKRAFCYLLAPPVHLLSDDARRRLVAIESYSELGSGFNIALQDLDIRGAGNLLGGEQSGYITDIGFEAYHKILNEALQELRESDFKEINFDENITTQDENFVPECLVETDFEIFFPPEYIQNVSERIRLYQELDRINDHVELEEFKTKITDRFGKLPEQSTDLFNIVQLRWNAKKLGIEKIVIRNLTMICYFVKNPDSMFYQSDIFMKIMQHAQNSGNKTKIREEKEKLSIVYYNVKNIDIANNIFSEIL